MTLLLGYYILFEFFAIVITFIVYAFFCIGVDFIRRISSIR